MWETEAANHDVALMERVRRNGGTHVKIGNRRLWSNSRAIIGKMLEEKVRRRGRQSLGLRPETKSWGEIIHEATLIHLGRREEDEEWKPSREPGRMILESEEEESQTQLDFSFDSGDILSSPKRKRRRAALITDSDVDEDSRNATERCDGGGAGPTVADGSDSLLVQRPADNQMDTATPGDDSAEAGRKNPDIAGDSEAAALCVTPDTCATDSAIDMPNPGACENGQGFAQA